MKPKLSDLETLARQAGEILRTGYGQCIQVDHKGVIDLVTDVDRRSEAFLLDAIRKRFPTHRVVAEESGVLEGEDGRVWYVDPLDGTVNYAHGVPIFAVSIAYTENGEIILGAVYDPMQDECFCAERGSGAWLNGNPLSVAGVQDLNDSLLVTGFPYDIRTNPENNLDHYANFALCSQGVRRLGSAALDLAYVAAGRFDGYWEMGIKLWDIAAGVLIVQEAGGTVTDIQGGPGYLSPSPSVLAANPHIHSQMLGVLRRNVKREA